MTRREFEEYKEALCPCGAGQITRHVESTDYRYTSIHTSYSLDCEGCRKEWRLDHGCLVLKASEEEYLALNKTHEKTRTELHGLARVIVKSYFEGKNLKTKKSELEHLQELKICKANYTQYTKYRREGRSISDIAYGLSNFEWLCNIAKSQELSEQLVLTASKNNELSERMEEAYKNVIRRSFK